MLSPISQTEKKEDKNYEKQIILISNKIMLMYKNCSDCTCGEQYGEAVEGYPESTVYYAQI